MCNWIDVSSEDAFPPGTHRVIDCDGVDVAIFRLADRYYAIEDRCSHDGGELSSGEIDDHEIVCPRHGARFCLRTGQALCAPAYEEISTYSVRVENGMVQLRDEAD